MTDKVTESTVKRGEQEELVPWWGYSREHGWVVLDRTVPCNAPGIKVELLFVRCRDVTAFPEARERWVPPHYRYARNHILDLPSPDADAAADELAELKVRWPEFRLEVQAVWRKMQERPAAARAVEEKTRKRAAAEVPK